MKLSWVECGFLIHLLAVFISMDMFNLRWLFMINYIFQILPVWLIHDSVYYENTSMDCFTNQAKYFVRMQPPGLEIAKVV